MELIVVIGIIGILAAMSTYGYGWLVAAQVEKQTRQIFTDLMNARMSAMQKNHVFFVSLASNQYAIYEDTYPVPDGDGAQTSNDRLVIRQNTSYPLDSFGTTNFNFAANGTCNLVSGASYTVRVVSNAAPSVDCIILSATRTLMGKWNGTCIAQ